MPPFTYRFDFAEHSSSQVTGTVELDEPLPFHDENGGSGSYRPGSIRLDDGGSLDLVLYHNAATAKFMYLRSSAFDSNLLDIIGLNGNDFPGVREIVLPGQLCMGSDRTKLIRQAFRDILATPAFSETVHKFHQQNLAIFPIAREGLKYQIAEAIYENYGYYCDEIVLDAHHVFDSSVPVYNRKVELTLFKDKDLDQHQRENVAVAFIADSIASGLVLKEVIEKIKQRFDRIQQVEVVAPLATVRGLCRIARADFMRNVKVRVHVFETLLNAMPPDYYYSSHFGMPEFHIRPDLEKEYRAWWGKDDSGAEIADTACAGYGWSEVFYSPRKQIEMMNGQLEMRHNLTIADIVRRRLA